MAIFHIKILNLIHEIIPSLHLCMSKLVSNEELFILHELMIEIKI